MTLTRQSSAVDRYDVAGGRVIGKEHRRTGRSCQDAFSWSRGPVSLVATVCDGCGSGRYSEVGATIGARLWSQALTRELASQREYTNVDAWRDAWTAARRSVCEALNALTIAMGGSPVDVVTHHFLFTVVGAAITPRHAAVFAIGDGVVAINDDVTVIGPFPDNQPPYLGYDLLDAPPEQPVSFCWIGDTDAVDSIVLATDGVTDLIEAASDSACTLPGRDEPAGDLAQFTAARYFRNRDAVRRRLALMNREVCEFDAASGRVRRSPGLLADDTAIVAIRRARGDRS